MQDTRPLQVSAGVKVWTRRASLWVQSSSARGHPLRLYSLAFHCGLRRVSQVMLTRKNHQGCADLGASCDKPYPQVENLDTLSPGESGMFTSRLAGAPFATLRLVALSEEPREAQ